MMREFIFDAFQEKETADKVSLRIGVYAYANLESNIEERFACADLAAERMKDDTSKICEFYELD